MTARCSTLLTIESAGERLGVSGKSVYRLIARGDLRAVDVHTDGTRSRTRIREDDLADFIERRTSAPARKVAS